MPPNAPQPPAPRSRLAWPLRAATVLLLLTALVGPTATPVAANPIGDAVEVAKEAVEAAKNQLQQLTQQVEANKNRVEQLNQLMEQTEQQLQQIRREGESARAALQRVRGELNIAELRLAAIKTELQKIDVHIRDLEAQQEELRAKLARRTAVYGQRLHVIYKLTQQPPLVLILGATDLRDFLERLNGFTVLAREDSRLVATVQRQQEQAEQVRRELDDEKAHATALQAEATEVKRILDIKRNQQQQLVTQIEAEEARTEQKLTEMDQEAERLTEQIRHQIEVELPRRQEEIRRREEVRRRAAAGQAGSQAIPAPSGSFIWPVSGPITAVYGQRTFAQRFHTGLDIAANLRVPVRAVATGSVLHVGLAVQGNRRASYGMYVTLLHGDGKVTLYAHLDDRVSPPPVERGQIIDQGKVLGAIGMTGITSGPHLHFEVRERDGRTRNPQEFLP